MATNEPYYGTQGGGTAVIRGGQLVWEEQPDWFTEAQVGDVVPEEWGIVGPFDRETKKPYVDIDD
jgi:hypothetical protein